MASRASLLLCLAAVVVHGPLPPRDRERRPEYGPADVRKDARGRIACRLSAGGGAAFSWSLVDVASGTLLMSGDQAAVYLDGKWWQAKGSES